MADLLVSEGYADVGYEYVNVDDCWLEKTRNLHGDLVPDRKRFPRGMKSLSEYVRESCICIYVKLKHPENKITVFSLQIHSRGLKFGIYQDFGKFKSIICFWF